MGRCLENKFSSTGLPPHDSFIRFQVEEAWQDWTAAPPQEAPEAPFLGGTMDRQSKTDGESGGDSTFDVILVILSVLMPRYQLFGVHTTNSTTNIYIGFVEFPVTVRNQSLLFLTKALGNHRHHFHHHHPLLLVIG